MNYRRTQLLASTSLTNNTTYPLNINVSNPISRITVIYKATNGDHVPDGHMNAGVSKIEIVDGSDVIMSMSGREAVATDFYDRGKPPVNIMTYINNNQGTSVFNLNFGRWLYDELLALDPRKFKGLQLKVTHNYANCGSSCDASTLQIWADVFDEKPANPIGYLMNKTLYSYTSGANGSYEYINLPTDYAMRRLTVFGLYPQYQPWQVVNEIKLSEDNDKRVPVDDKVSNILKIVAQTYGMYHESILLHATTSDQAFFCTPSYETYFATGDPEDGDTNVGTSRDSYGGDLYVEGEAAGQFNFLVQGYAPHGAIPVMFGKEADHSDWYDVQRVGSLVLRLKAGSLGATGTPTVVTQQLRTY